MLNFSRIIPLFLIAIGSLFGEIIETKHFNEVLNHLQPNTLVIYDIDNTLIEMNQLLGSDHWFYFRLKSKIASGNDERLALEETLNEWEAIQHLSGCKLVEASTLDVVSETQRRGKVIGLTTRGFALANRALQLLDSVGLDLSKNAISDKEMHFMVQNEGTLYRKGVMFSSGRPKGLALKALLDGLDYHPEHIVFVDDKKSSLLSVESYCEAEGIPFIGLRYGYMDEKVASLDPEVAEIQWSHFGKILSDEEAERLK